MYVDEKNLENIWDLLEIKTIKDLVDFVENDVFDFIMNEKKGDLEKVFNFKNLDKQKFRELVREIKMKEVYNEN